MTELPKRIAPEASQLSALAALYQRWGEICKARALCEITPALAWLLHGMAIAHKLDAWRARDALHPAVQARPPTEDTGLVAAFETFMGMLTQFGAVAPAPAADPTHPTPPALEDPTHE